jgi:shikimate kinase
MHNYLISGLPGTGKTTIEHELQKLSYEVINTDDSWGYFGDIEAETPVERPANPTKDWFKKHGWIWNSRNIRLLLEVSHKKPLFICSGSRNENKFYDLFDRVFVLHIPDDVMRQRLLARNDPLTSSELHISRMIAYNQDAYDHARRINGIVIETTKPLDQCVQRILDVVHEN